MKTFKMSAKDLQKVSDLVAEFEKKYDRSKMIIIFTSLSNVLMQEMCGDNLQGKLEFWNEVKRQIIEIHKKYYGEDNNEQTDGRV